MGGAGGKEGRQRLRQRGGGGDVAESQLERGRADCELHSQGAYTERHDHALGGAHDRPDPLLDRDCKAVPHDGSQPGREPSGAVEDAMPASGRERVVDVQLGPHDALALRQHVLLQPLLREGRVAIRPGSV